MLRPRWQIAIALLVVGGAAGFVATHAPEAGSVYPPCPSHALLGLHCAGCGSLRAISALTHGHVGEAFGFNPLAVLFLALIGPWWAWQAWLGLRHDRFASVVTRPAASWAVVVIVVVYTVARNLPWPPFCWLAPNN